MRVSKWLCFGLLVALCLAAVGCARAARSTEGFGITDSATVNVPFEEAWQATKAVLREQKFDIYTRDKRGVFVAFTKMKRELFLVPKRVKYVVSLEKASESSTTVTVEAVRQVFGVTLLTYPGWHDRKLTDHAGSQAILQALEAKVAGGDSSKAGAETSAPTDGSQAKS
jgi:hypothetical protein